MWQGQVLATMFVLVVGMLIKSPFITLTKSFYKLMTRDMTALTTFTLAIFVAVLLTSVWFKMNKGGGNNYRPNNNFQNNQPR